MPHQQATRLIANQVASYLLRVALSAFELAAPFNKGLSAACCHSSASRNPLGSPPPSCVFYFANCFRWSSFSTKEGTSELTCFTQMPVRRVRIYEHMIRLGVHKVSCLRCVRAGCICVRSLYTPCAQTLAVDSLPLTSVGVLSLGKDVAKVGPTVVAANLPLAANLDVGHTGRVVAPGRWETEMFLSDS